MSRRALSLFVVAMVALVATTGSTLNTGRTRPRIAVISAFGGELEAFKAQAQIEETVVVNGRSVYLGTLGGHSVLMTLSGGSMINAAMSTQAILDHFNVERIVFSGIAGGVNPGLRVGDVAVPSRWAEYQENFFVNESEQGFVAPDYAKEWLLGLPNFGMMFPQGVSITSVSGEPDAQSTVLWFEADRDMLAAARSAAQGITLEECVDAATCLSHVPIVRVGGNGVSGPTFVDNAEYRTYVWQTWRADALDMESAAVAHVATVNGVPFVIFRSLSDLAGGGPGVNEINTFWGLAAGNSARVMLAFLEEWE